MHSLSQAVEALKIIKEGELGEEKEALKELQQEREDYNEVMRGDHKGKVVKSQLMQEVAELAKECAVADDGEVLTESKASARLGRRVEGLISQVNRAIDAINIDDIPVEERLHVVTNIPYK